MGTYVGSISLRDAEYSSIAALIAAFNKMDEAITGCGMVRASDVEDPGQAGTFVAGSPGAGETQVTASTAYGYMASQGYKTYKLPDSLAGSAPVLVRCHFCASGYSTSHLVALFTFSAKLGSGPWSPSPSVNVPGLYIISTWDLYAFSLSNITAAPKSLVAACGEGYFYVSVEESGVVPASYTGSVSYPPKAVSLVGAGVFRPRVEGSLRSGGLLLTAPCLVNSVGTGFNYRRNSTSSPLRGYGMQAFKLDSGIWAEMPAAPFAGLSDPLAPAAGGGLRVVVPRITFNSELAEIAAGVTTLGNAPTAGMLVDVDLLSSSPLKCRAVHGFMDCVPWQDWQTHAAYLSTRSVLLLPWEPDA